MFYEKLKAHHSSSLSDASQATSIPYNELGRDLVGEGTLVIVGFIIKMNIPKDINSKRDVDNILSKKLKPSSSYILEIYFEKKLVSQALSDRHVS